MDITCSTRPGRLPIRQLLSGLHVVPETAEEVVVLVASQSMFLSCMHWCLVAVVWVLVGHNI